MVRWFAKREKERERRDELLSAYLDGRLDARERARLEAQLASDPALYAELAALRRTVTLVRSLPRVPAPRNFILPQTVALRPRPAPLRSRRLFAPLLTTATSIAALLFIAVLVSDLWSAKGSRLSMAPAAAPAPVEERQAVIVTAAVEQQDLGDVATAPVLAMAVPTEEAIRVAGEGESEGAPPALPSPAFAAPAALEESPAPAPTFGLAAPEEATTVPSPTPTVAAVRAYATGPTPTEAAGIAPPPDEQQDAKRAGGEQSEPEAVVAGRSVSWPWRVLEIALGLTALALGLATIWAWHVRRR